MPRFVIEREVPGAGKLSPEELQEISQRSCEVNKELGPSIQWIHSFVTEDKIYCIYLAPNEELVREASKMGNLPCNLVAKVVRIIDPTTAEPI